MFRKLKNKDCVNLSIQYEKENQVERMEVIENLEKQGVRVCSP